MKRVALLLLAAVCSAACSEKQPRLECRIQEQSGRTLILSAALSGPQPPDGGRDFQGEIEFGDGAQRVRVPSHGVYLEPGPGRELELLTFAELPNRQGKLDIAVQPDHQVLRQRGTTAVVMTGEQTVHNGTPATVSCQTVETS